MLGPEVLDNNDLDSETDSMAPNHPDNFPACVVTKNYIFWLQSSLLSPPLGPEVVPLFEKSLT